MPVWHERTRTARASGELVLVGIAEEQHPDRCALFAQWRELDWPVLWDPFNLTESSAVPLAIGVDEHGIVREVGMKLEELEEFLAADFAAPGTKDGTSSAGGEPLVEGGSATPHARAMNELMAWGAAGRKGLAEREIGEHVDALERWVASSRGAPVPSFRLGVALRLRAESAFHRDGDLQASFDLWRAALRQEPGQYVWRRRIQQWGPPLDKPYPFYDWIEQAVAELRDRGVEPVELQVALTTSEVAGKGHREGAEPGSRHPDPDERVPRDEERWIRLEAATVEHTGDGEEGEQVAPVQVHLTLRPDRVRDVHWTNDAGEAEIWVDEPLRWGLPGSRYPMAAGDAPESAETRTVDLSVTPGPGSTTMTGTAFYYVCEGTGGECRFLAQDFEVRVPAR